MIDYPDTDGLLLVAVGEGNLEAFEEIVRRNQDWAWRIAFRFLGRKEEAEDVVQDAFLRLLDASNRYRPTALLSDIFLSNYLSPLSGPGQKETTILPGKVF